MADTNMNMPMEPIPLPVMGMTTKEYQAAFMSLDHANFAHEIEEFEDQRRRGSMAVPQHISVFRRFEFWATFLSFAAFFHAIFVQWAWPPILEWMHRNSTSVHYWRHGQ